jgi:hypothetical protein
MKTKLLLGLALVLSGGLLGCSTVPSGSLSDSAEGKLFSNHEAVCLKSADSKRPWQLTCALTERTWNEGELFLTVHKRISSLDHPQYDPESTAAIYFKTGGKFKLLKRIWGNDSVFLKPNVIWVAPKGEDRVQLIQIPEQFYGSGGLIREHFFAPEVLPMDDSKPLPDASEIKLGAVGFTNAWESYHFERGTHLWKGERNTFTDQQMRFEFLVWKNDKTAGEVPVDKITGTYRLERSNHDGGWQIVVNTLKHEPVKDDDWH